MNDTPVDKISEMGFDPNNISGFTPSDATDVKRISVDGLRYSIIKLAPYIYDKAWILFRAPDTESYYISDNPVTLQNMNDYGPYGNLGLAVRGIEIYFPFVFSGIDNFDLIREMFKDNIDFKKPPRMQKN